MSWGGGLRRRIPSCDFVWTEQLVAVLLAPVGGYLRYRTIILDQFERAAPPYFIVETVVNVGGGSRRQGDEDLIFGSKCCIVYCKKDHYGTVTRSHSQF
jgi:hypothetical protein